VSILQGYQKKVVELAEAMELKAAFESAAASLKATKHDAARRIVVVLRPHVRLLLWSCWLPVLVEMTMMATMTMMSTAMMMLAAVRDVVALSLLLLNLGHHLYRLYRCSVLVAMMLNPTRWFYCYCRRWS
jgi:hypothetical protein